MNSIIGTSIFVGTLLALFCFGLWLLMGGGDDVFEAMDGIKRDGETLPDQENDYACDVGVCDGFGNAGSGCCDAKTGHPAPASRIPRT